MIDAAPFVEWLQSECERIVRNHTLWTLPEGRLDPQPPNALRVIAERTRLSEDWLRKGAFRHTGLILQADVEDVLEACGYAMFDVYPDGSYDEGETERRVEGRKRGKPCGVYGNMTDQQVRAAHMLYDRQGLSLNGLGALLWERFGYASPDACANSLGRNFIRLGLPRRDRIAATVAASLKHGRARRKPYRTDEADYRAYRAEQKRANGEIRDVPCHGVRVQYPRKGEPCQRPALRDSDFCIAHDPRYADWREQHLAEARQRLGLAPTTEEIAA